MFASTNIIFLLLATLISSTLSHPLNLMHSHHRHRTHRHLHLRLPYISNAARPALNLQQPISGPAPVPTPDISNVFVNMTIRSSESSAPSSFLIPLRAASSPQVELTAAIFHHPRTAMISNIQYGTDEQESSRQFGHSKDVACYAHIQSPSSQSQGQTSQEKKPQPIRLELFRQSDGEVDFAEADGKWFAAEGQVSGFDCVLKL